MTASKKTDSLRQSGSPGDIDLRSDTVTLPNEGMRQAMMSAELGDDVIDIDPTVQRLQHVIAERVGQAGIQVCAEVAVAGVREFLDEGPDIPVGTPAVAAHDEWLGMGDCVPESLGVLAGQYTAADIREGHGDHQRNLGT